MKLNKPLSKPFLRSLFIVQNKWHSHSVLVHTLAVTWQVIKARDWKMLAAGLLHDVGKPYTAIKKDQEDIDNNWYSFTNHEEISYQIIKNWFFVSEYTKQLVRYHYLIRDLKKSKTRNLPRYHRLKRRWDKLDDAFKKDLETFLAHDDGGK